MYVLEETVVGYPVAPRNCSVGIIDMPSTEGFITENFIFVLLLKILLQHMYTLARLTINENLLIEQGKSVCFRIKGGL